MEDEYLKRNTDCVYFLASPLTCKKGLECEFRHNEMARLNPRECYYWLSSNCLNPTCAFRHPPLDAPSETVSEASSAKLPSALPANNKRNAPCYYFYNGYCSKGEACLFMHGPDGNASSLMSTKQAPAVADAQIPERKVSKESDSTHGVAEVSSFTDDSKSAVRTTVRRPIPDNSTKQNAHGQISESPSDDANTIKSNSSIHTNKTFAESPQSSDDQFDVLVNNQAEETEYDDEALDDREREIDGQRYEYDDMIEYERRVSYERELPEYVGYLDGEPHNLSRGTSVSARGRVGGEDLRDHLLNRRMAKAYQTGQDTETASLGARRIHGRLASKVEVSVEPRMDRELHWRDTHHQRHRETHAIPVIKRSRKETKGRKPGKRHFLSDVSEKAAPRKRRIIEDPTMFTGPKTLAQLKEEKKRTLGDGAAPPSSSDA